MTNENARILFRRLHIVSLCCVAITMPFSFEHLKFSSYSIVLLALLAVPLFLTFRNEIRPLYNGMLLLFISFYLIYVIGLLSTDNFHEASYELQRKLGMALLPLLIFYLPKLNKKEITMVLLCFVLSCLLTVLYCLSVASYHYLSNGDSSFYFYHSLSGIAGMHASYLGMYLCFSIAILLCTYYNDSRYFNVFENICYYTIISVFTITVVLLSVRMSLAILTIGLITFIFIRFQQRIGFVRSLLSALGIGIFILGIVFVFPKTRDRFKEAIKGNRQSLDKHWGWAGSTVRELQWNCAVELFKTHPFTGVGTGDVQEELDRCYSKHKYVILLYYWNKVRYNAHNQFLETSVELGLPGLILLLLGFYSAFSQAFKKKKTIFIVFLAIFFLSCLTESMLERQSGIVFYAFFNSLFAFNEFSSKQSNFD